MSEPWVRDKAALARLRGMAERATKGPWVAGDDEGNIRPIYGPDGDAFIIVNWNPGRDNDVDADAEYLANVSPDVVLALLDELEEWQADSR